MASDRTRASAQQPPSLPRSIPPPLLLAASLVAVILVGTVLLCLPVSQAKPGLSWLDAFFTATSAACVTGLVVVDTGSTFSRFGQAVILVLIQIGGIGVMTVGTLVIFALGQRPTALLRQVVSGFASHRRTLRAREILGVVLATTFSFEIVGALLLYPVFAETAPPGEAAWQAVFHSVSAFCNAGFALWPDSFVGFADSPLLNVTVMTLIVFGGLGFVVLVELRFWIVSVFRRGTALQQLTLHSRIVLAATTVAIVLGTAMVLLFEASHALAGRPLSERLWVSLFQSVTARTAGFNTIDIGSLTTPTLLCLIALMFVGAGPGSTAGGIKVTSAATLLSYLSHISRGHREVSLFRRRIGEATIERAIIISTTALVVVGVVILLFEAGRTSDLGAEASRTGFLAVVFEVVSAFGTVGLSMGITADLDALQKLLLVPLMFLGRVGPLTLMEYYQRLPPGPNVRHAKEELVVG